MFRPFTLSPLYLCRNEQSADRTFSFHTNFFDLKYYLLMHGFKFDIQFYQINKTTARERKTNEIQ